MPDPVKFSAQEIQSVLSAERATGREQSCRGVSIDSRTLRPGELYVAIRGRRFDGHDFTALALAQGAAGAVVERWPLPGIGAEPAGTVWQVKDTLSALGALARFHRERFSIPLAAITGSSGKSTTKTMLAYLLSGSGTVLSSPGTQNNRIGVPLALFRLDEQHRAAVLELGTNQWGEIRALARICRPTVGVVTNIGPAHLEAFGDLQGVLREKGALWEELVPAAPVVLNADDPLLRAAGRSLNRPVVWFGTAEDAQVRGSDFRGDWRGSACRVNGRWDLRLPMPGRHNLMNALAALACAQVLGEDLETAVHRLSGVEGLPGRLAVTERDGLLLVDDTYNANPASLRAALQLLAEMKVPGRRIAVLGDMLELGAQAGEFHAEAGRRAAEAGVDLLVAVGAHASRMVEAACAAGLKQEAGRAFSVPEEAGEFLLEWARPGDAVLVKGSRGMRMERVITCFTTSSIP